MSEPRRYVQGTPISTGDVFITITGRHAAPVPKQDFTTNRRALNSGRRWAEWLIAQAIAEATSRGRDDLVAGWSHETPKNLPPASSDSMWGYTFECESLAKLDAAQQPFTRPLLDKV